LKQLKQVKAHKPYFLSAPEQECGSGSSASPGRVGPDSLGTCVAVEMRRPRPDLGIAAVLYGNSTRHSSTITKFETAGRLYRPSPIKAQGCPRLLYWQEIGAGEPAPRGQDILYNLDA
jgi:hypothetical protein